MINNFKVTVLSENSSSQKRLKSEHGLSFYIETETNKYLFDTGASDIFKRNAEILKINLEDTDAVVVSHNHYDHTGGLEFLYDKKVYVHNQFFQKKYKKIEGQFIDIGISQRESAYTRLQFEKIEKTIAIDANTQIICDFKKNDYEDYFYLKVNETMQPDVFADELAMSFNTTKGLVIVTGCSHSGIIHIIDKAIDVNKTKNIYALLGGFHLSKVSEEENKIVAEKLRTYQIGNIGISHCTGDKLIKYQTFGNYFNFNVGDKFELGTDTNLNPGIFQ